MLVLPPELRNRIITYTQAGFPNEACGLLAGEIREEERFVKGVYGLKNADESPEHFSMAPEDQFRVIAEIRKKGWVLLGNFHSHPSTPARPSGEDIRLAFDPSLSYVIVSFEGPEPVLKCFRIQNGLVEEEAVRE
ncbi:MAG: M67 family metallopeptidase [Treponema sp.]|jgi:proteasome lid subunit RPN8/RPN11|nr:M67 family metallopeptidase [Treponema sp.]